MFQYMRSQAQKNRMIGRFFALDTVEFVLVFREKTLAFGGWQIALVGKIVSRTGERIDGRDRRTQPRRQ